MKRVKIADLKNQLSRHLRAVEQGAEIEVTDRQRPIVRLVPIRSAEPQIRILPARRPFSQVRNRRYAKARWRTASLRLLLASGDASHARWPANWSAWSAGARLIAPASETGSATI